MLQPNQGAQAPAESPFADTGGRNRSLNYDYLRVFAMFMVILNHIADPYLWGFDPPVQSVYIYEGISHCAVPLFLMLTGAFVISKAGTVSPREFYLHSAKKLGIPLLIIASLYYVYDVVFHGADFSYIRDTLLTGFYGVYAHWYVAMLAVIYAFIPLVALIRKSVPYEKYEKAAVIVFVWLTVGHYYEYGWTTWSLSNLYYMGYVLIGDVLATRFRDRKNNVAGALLAVLGIAALACNHWIVYTAMISGNEPLYNLFNNYYSAPLIVLGSILVFIGFSVMEIKRSISFVARASYTVFLIHKLIITILLEHTSVLQIVEQCLNDNVILYIPGNVIVLFLISFAFSIAFDFLLDKTVCRKKK